MKITFEHYGHKVCYDTENEDLLVEDVLRIFLGLMVAMGFAVESTVQAILNLSEELEENQEAFIGDDLDEGECGCDDCEDIQQDFDDNFPINGDLG